MVLGAVVGVEPELTVWDGDWLEIRLVYCPLHLLLPKNVLAC